MTHRPTFKPSSSKRSRLHRLTPLAWSLIGVGGLAAILILFGVGAAHTRRATDWNPTPTETLPSTIPPTPTEAPSPTPTSWWEGIVPSTPESSPPFPAWWSDQMSQDEEGRWWPPAEVVEMVKGAPEARREAARIALIDTTPPDYAAYEEVLRDWTDGPQLEGRLVILSELRVGTRPLSFLQWGTCIYEVQDWSADGLECTLGITCQDGTYAVYDNENGQLLSEEQREQSGLTLMRMRYDPWVGRWKEYRFLDHIPPP